MGPPWTWGSKALCQSGEEPGTRGEEPGTRGEEPGTREKEPGTREKEPGTRGKEPGPREEEPGTRGEEPGTREKEPGTREKEPGPRGEEPGTKEKQPGPRGEEPGTREKEPGTREKEPGPDEGACSAEEERRERWSLLFRSLDLNGDGHIDMSELRTGLRGRGLSRRSLEKMVEVGDTNQDGVLDFEEFSQYLRAHEEQLKTMFHKLDQNHDGQIDAAEIQECLRSMGVKISLKDATRILLSMDRDGTRTIDWDEWRDHFLFNPLTNMEEVARYWKHSMMLDIGDQLTVPDDYSEAERLSGLVWRQLLAGGLAGCVSRTGTAPLDRIKVFRQAQVASSGPFSGSLLSSFRFMLREGGVRSFWRGNGVNVLKIAPETAIKFTAYDQIKSRIRGDDERNLKIYERFVAGCLAGGAAQTSIYPLEVLKTRLTLRSSAERSGVFACVRLVLRREGASAFYKGLVPNLLSIVPHAGVDLAVYETLKYAWLNRNRGVADPGVLVLVGCGAVSGTCGQLAGYPLALIRTRMQAEASEKGSPRLSMVTLVRAIVMREGVWGLYRGISPNLLKVVPAVSVSYVAYEYTRLLLGVDVQGRRAAGGRG